MKIFIILILKEDKFVKVLQVTGALNMGGAETMLMNVYREINRDKIQFDFIVSGKEIGFYESEAI